MLIKIKPLSVNECWQGQRFKTPLYKAYEKELLYRLPALSLPAPPYMIYFEFGLSSSNSDWDNPIKPFQDILQKKYGFNDRHIDLGITRKVRVKKGEEYVRFKISTLDDSVFDFLNSVR